MLPMDATSSAPAEQLENLTDEELAEKLNPTTPAPVADKVDVTKPAEPEAPAPNADKAEPIKVDLEAENGKLKKQLENLQAIFGRQSNELGELRKVLKDKPTSADFDADPVKAAEDLQARQDQEKEIQKIEQDQAVKATAIRNMQFLTQYAPDLPANADLIREVLKKEDKLEDGDINKFTGEIFLQNPWGVYQLNQRAKLFKQIKELNAEIEKLKQVPAATLNRIKQINQVASNITAAAGQAVQPVNSDIEPVALANLSDDELEAHLKQLKDKSNGR
jgi:hypothetical protein